MKKTYFALAIILTVAALLRIPLVAQGFFAFTYDQGRDFLAVSQIVETHKIPLIGPTTGLQGIFYGPWWYYFLVPLFLITNGNPTGIALAFSVIGIINVFLFFFLIKKITGSDLAALGVAAIAAMSSVFLTSSSQIWSPSLVLPLMLLYVYSLVKIFEKHTKLWFFLLGLSSALVMESGAAFGIVLIISTFIAFIFFSKDFFRKNLIFFFLGLMLIFLPRIIFELRHNFLITKSTVDWLSHPRVYQEKLNILQRFFIRIDLFDWNLAQTFTRSNKILTLIPILAIVLGLKLSKFKLLKNKLFKFLSILTIIILLGFTIYPDALWDYYLVGLPQIALTIFAISIAHLLSYAKKLAISILTLTIILGFNTQLLSPFLITWLGDGAIYRNQKMVMDYIASQKPQNYSFYAYTPAIFDYPFDYIVDWYARRGLIEKPKSMQKSFYLVIRDKSNKKYFNEGWYGDKTRDKTQVIDKKEFPGDLLLEKHIRND
ncbi:MAG: glycosyltransferase family 39 protein [Candidatus Curtissbacteria bacterium]|nr:glycosyltransferase family 39 protein [Candidatus Curtissbacteria bacterium]